MKSQGICSTQKMLLVFCFILLPPVLAMPVMQASRHYQLQREITSSLRTIETAFEESRREAAEREGSSRFAQLYISNKSSALPISGSRAENNEEEEDGQ